MNSLFRYILGQLSVLGDDDLKELDFDSARNIVNTSDINEDDRAKILKLFQAIQTELGLNHHGILGQKWGVRRFQNKDGTLTAAGQKRYDDTIDQKKKSVFDHAESFQIKTRTGETINADPVKPWSVGKKIINGLLGVREKDELGRRGDANYTLSDSKGNKLGELSLINKNSDTAYLDWITIDTKQRGKGYATDIINDLLTKANDAGYSKVELNALKEPRPLYERLGFTYTDTSKMSIMDRVNSFEFGCKHMEYDLKKLQHANAAYLSHHGIIGMKWGVRRYQNKDGSLTNAGQKRYNSDNTKQLEKEYGKLEDQMTYGKNANAKKNAALMKRMSEIEKEMSTKKKEAPAHEDYTKAHNSKSVKSMSDAELRNRLNRLQMEKQYKQLSSTDVNRGKEYVSKTLKVAGTVATATTTALTIYNNYGKIKEIVNGMAKKTG